MVFLTLYGLMMIVVVVALIGFVSLFEWLDQLRDKRTLGRSDSEST